MALANKAQDAMKEKPEANKEENAEKPKAERQHNSDSESDEESKKATK